jgi:hypothetical protein
VVTPALAIVLVATSIFAVPTQAHAAKRARVITRAQVMKRASQWVKRRVPYSQHRTYGGYRQDCSGFVSMAWQLGRSYTSRSLGSVSRRVSRSVAKHGDAVWTPGHVVIFGGWKNRRAGTFYAYEEPTWGGVAHRRVRKLTAHTRFLRRRGIIDSPRRRRIAPIVAAAPAPVLVASVVPVSDSALVTPAPATSPVPVPLSPAVMP